MPPLHRLASTGVVALASCNAIAGFGDLEKVTSAPEVAALDAGASPRDASGAETSSPDATGGAACDPTRPFGPPKALEGPVNSAGMEGSPTLTDDELVIVFDRTVNVFSRSIVTATRASRAEPFGAPSPMPELTQGLGVEVIGAPTMTGDGLALFYFGEVGGDDADIFTASRSVVTARFGDARKVSRVNTTQVEVFPSVMSNGAELWFTSERLGGITRHLFRSVRDSIGLYQEAALVTELKSENNEAGVAFSADGLTVFFGSDRPSGLGQSDVWTARRPALQAAFGQATPVAELNSASEDRPAWLSPDGCRLYLTSDRAGSNDIYVATRP